METRGFRVGHVLSCAEIGRCPFSEEQGAGVVCLDLQSKSSGILLVGPCHHSFQVSDLQASVSRKRGGAQGNSRLTTS